MINVNIQRKSDTALLPYYSYPSYAYPGDAGCDLCSDEQVVLLPKTPTLVRTGLAIELPVGYEAQIRPRSGLALKHLITVFNSPGTIDPGYRGELKICLYNFSDVEFVVNHGDRIAQMVIAPIVQASFTVVEQLNDSERGESGWGSSGVNSITK